MSIEDDQVQADMLEYHLLQLNMCNEVVTAPTLAAAREALESDTFDLIISDIRLPDGNGIDFIEETRAKHPHLAFIVLSALNDMDYVAKADRLGVVLYVRKPITVALVAEIAKEFEKINFGLMTSEAAL